MSHLAFLTTLRLAVLTVGLITFSTVVAVTALLFGNHAAPEGLIAIGASGAGALATLLTTSGQGDREELKLRGTLQAAMASPENAQSTADAITSLAPPTNQGGG